MENKPAYKRVLLKLSGEALLGRYAYGIDPDVIHRIADEVKTVVEMGVEVSIVIGGGNLFRGAGLAEGGMDRVTGDQIGMLATVMNSLAFQDALRQKDVSCRVVSATKLQKVCEDYSRDRALSHLQKGRVVIFAGGTGNPFFTTDSAASLRAIEMKSDVMIKATKVDGIYSEDPAKNPDAERFETISYKEVIQRDLQVMDTTAVVMCRDNNMPLMVFNLLTPGDLIRLLMGENVGSKVI